MKILLINDYKKKNIGGAELVFYNLKNLLEENNHGVEIWGSELTSKKEIFFSIFNLKYYFKLKNFLKNKHFDIIHIHKINSVLSHSILLTLKERKVILHVHDFSYICPKMGVTYDNKECSDWDKRLSFHKNCRRYKERRFNFLYDLIKVIRLNINRYLTKKYVDHFICPSKKLKELMQKTFNIPDNKITLLQNFIEINQDTKSIPTRMTKNNQFLFVGRISKEKGVNILIKAVKLIKGECPDILVKIIGDGPEKKNLEQFVKRLNLEGNIKFLGRIPNEKLPQYYQKSFAVIMSSFWMENCPIVGLEAMANKVPIVASNIGGFPDLVEHNKNGYLFRIGNYEELAKYIKKLYKNIELSKKMGEYGFEKLKKEFNKKDYSNKLITIYKNESQK